MVNRIRICATVLLVLILCACTAQKPETFEIGGVLEDYSTSLMTPVTERETDYQYVYLMQWANKQDQILANERATKLAQDAGFRLIFSLSDTMNYNNGGDPYSLKKALEASSGGVTLLYDDMLSDIKITLGDFYEQAAEWSPNYLSRAVNVNYPGTLQFIPVGRNEYPKRPAVFIRGDVYDEYGHEITGGGALEDLLIWLKMKYPDSTPCIDLSSLPVTYSIDAAARYEIGRRIADEKVYKAALNTAQLRLKDLKNQLFNTNKPASDTKLEELINTEFDLIRAIDKLDTAEALMREYKVID